MMMPPYFNVINDCFYNWSVSGFIILAMNGARFVHWGMDRITGSSFNVTILKRIYRTILQRVSETTLALMLSCLPHDEVSLVTYTVHCTKWQVCYRVLKAKDGVMWDNGTVLFLLSDLVIICDDYYRTWVFTSIWSQCTVRRDIRYMCPYSAISDY